MTFEIWHAALIVLHEMGQGETAPYTYIANEIKARGLYLSDANVIQLGKCFDLLDESLTRVLAQSYLEWRRLSRTKVERCRVIGAARANCGT